MEKTLENEWSKYLLQMKDINNLSISNISCQLNTTAAQKQGQHAEMKEIDNSNRPPKCDYLSISTKTKVLFLNKPVDIENIFWQLPILPYWKPEIGILKKTIKIVSMTPEDTQKIKDKIATIEYCKEDLLKSINIQTGHRTRYKEERKITIGFSKKDIMALREKKKNVFYNCFSIVIRIFYNNNFHEIHTKIFNTGKMEIPGIINDEILLIAMDMILCILQHYNTTPCVFINEEAKNHNVLINSNFNCGFYINREKLSHILQDKYNLDTSYDPCIYPGVKCKFYYHNNKPRDTTTQLGIIMENDHHLKIKHIQKNNNYTEVSIMIFRTGSGLIVGNCTDEILEFVFQFITTLLHTEYSHICIVGESCGAGAAAGAMKEKRPKIHKKIIQVLVGGTVAAAAAADVVSADTGAAATDI